MSSYNMNNSLGLSHLSGCQPPPTPSKLKWEDTYREKLEVII